MCRELSSVTLLNAAAKGVALSKLSRRYSIPRDILQEWRDSYSLGFPVIGGYCKLDECVVDSLSITKIAAFSATNGVDDEHLDIFRTRVRSFIAEQASETVMRRSISAMRTNRLRLKP